MVRSGNSRSVVAAAFVLSLAAVLSVATVQTASADDSPAPAGIASSPVQQQTPAPAPGSVPGPAPGSVPGGLPAQPAPPPAFKPGFLHQLGVWWDDSFSNFNTKMRAAKDKLDDYNKKQDQAARDASTATQQALKDAAQATKDAATAVVKLPNTRVFELHERCLVAGNGAPDCQTTVANVCRAKGFNDGHPLDVSTAEECPAKVLLAGRPPVEGECHDVTTVLKVVCQ